jgi:nitroreductase
VIVTDPAKRAQLGELYRAAGTSYLERQYARADEGSQLKRVMGSAVWLAQNIEKVPVHVIPCIEGRLTSQASALAWAGQMGSIFPAVWSFQLALRSRGLGTVITSLHLASEEKVAELLGIPDDVMQVALLPVAYTKGTEFRPAERPPPEAIVHWDSWGNMRGG